jgi:hypothetical protein
MRHYADAGAPPLLPFDAARHVAVADARRSLRCLRDAAAALLDAFRYGYTLLVSTPQRRTASVIAADARAML